jgi:hypothetical protein
VKSSAKRREAGKDLGGRPRIITVIVSKPYGLETLLPTARLVDAYGVILATHSRKLS